VAEERSAGVERVLAHAWAYELLQVAVGSRRSHDAFVTQYVRPTVGARILDLGCGPGHVLKALPADVEYVGIDSQSRYIDAAREHWGERGTFRVADGRDGLGPDSSFDIVLGMGILHHLDDAGCRALLHNAAGALVPAGRLVTIDPAHSERQSTLARWLIGRDRGLHVRSAEGYADLARASFGAVTSELRTNLLRIPYTHAVLTCSQPVA
jgi:2-polyprenyl-3-methyl-5-hydroxy-6-metoxy-1,4-benzoquinol methylase